MRIRKYSIFICMLAFFVPHTSDAQVSQLSAAERAQLEVQLQQVEAEQAQAQQQLTSAQAESGSLQQAIDFVTAKIKTEQLDIQAKNLQIQTLGNTIQDKQSEIDDLNSQIQTDKDTIADSLREMYMIETSSPLSILLSDTTLSGFLQDADRFDTLQQDLQSLSTQLALTESSTTVEKNNLTIQQNTAIDARYTIQQDQKSLQNDQAQQKQLLTISQKNASSYATLVAQKKTQINAINAKLFALAGGSNPIQFGQAYQYAQAAASATGIDPAFLLAILTQESNLGTNQGTCYLTNPNTGAGVSVKSGHSFPNVMSPTRDVPPFLQITSTLEVNPYQTIVSCPQSVGWGGAMGPAQFIASTWMLFSDRIGKALGFSGLANPWNPQHAFMASALYLSDLGATSGSYTSERNAACKYYSGSSCSKSALVASYGDSVMSLASNIQQTEINQLKSI